MPKMTLGTSDSQASSTASVMSSRMEALTSAMTALSAFINAEELKGKAYSSAQSYATSVLFPLLNGAALYSEALSEGTSRLPKDYRATPDLGDEDLDSTVLESELETLKSTEKSLNASISALEADDPAKADLDSQLSSTTARREKVERQLAALVKYDETSASFFENLTDLENAVSQGITAVTSAMTDFDGTFKVPSSDERAWATSLAEKWNKRQKALETLKKGEDLTKEDIETLGDYVGISGTKEKEILVYDTVYGYAKYTISVTASKDGELSVSYLNGKPDSISAGDATFFEDETRYSKDTSGLGGNTYSGMTIGSSALGGYNFTGSYTSNGKTVSIESGLKMTDKGPATYTITTQSASVSDGGITSETSVGFERGSYIRRNDPNNVTVPAGEIAGNAVNSVGNAISSVNWGTVATVVGYGLILGIAAVASGGTGFAAASALIIAANTMDNNDNDNGGS